MRVVYCICTVNATMSQASFLYAMPTIKAPVRAKLGSQARGTPALMLPPAASHLAIAACVLVDTSCADVFLPKASTN